MASRIPYDKKFRDFQLRAERDRRVRVGCQSAAARNARDNHLMDFRDHGPPCSWDNSPYFQPAPHKTSIVDAYKGPLPPPEIAQFAVESDSDAPVPRYVKRTRLSATARVRAKACARNIPTVKVPRVVRAVGTAVQSFEPAPLGSQPKMEWRPKRVRKGLDVVPHAHDQIEEERLAALDKWQAILVEVGPANSKLARDIETAPSMDAGFAMLVNSFRKRAPTICIYVGAGR